MNMTLNNSNTMMKTAVAILLAVTLLASLCSAQMIPNECTTQYEALYQCQYINYKMSDSAIAGKMGHCNQWMEAAARTSDYYYSGRCVKYNADYCSNLANPNLNLGPGYCNIGYVCTDEYHDMAICYGAHYYTGNDKDECQITACPEWANAE